MEPEWKFYEVLDTIILQPGQQVGLKLDDGAEALLIEKGVIQPIEEDEG